MQGMVYAGVGIAMMVPMMSYAAVDPQTPASSNLAVSLACGIGVLCFCVGAIRLLIGHHVASCFQMVSRLEGGREVERVGSNASCLKPYYLLTLFPRSPQVYSLETTKANQWTRWLTKLSVLVGYGIGTGCAICMGGLYFGNDQKGTDAILMTGTSIAGIFFLIGAATIAYGVWEIRALQRTISTVSSTGKAL
jgi:hypothetical protein